MPPIDAQRELAALADALIAHRRETGYGVYGGARVDRPNIPFDDLTLECAQREAAFHRGMLSRLDRIDLRGAPAIAQVEAATLRHVYEFGAKADEDYFLEFAITPYTGGDRLARAIDRMKSTVLATSDDLAVYLRLLDAYVALLRQTAGKTRAQIERGIRVSKPDIEGVRKTFNGLADSAGELQPPDARLPRLATAELAAFARDVERRIGSVRQACADILALVDADYVDRAPDEVGLWRYPGGRERYHRLIAYEGYGHTAAEINEVARAQVVALEAEMAQVRRSMGYDGTAAAFHAELRRSPRLVVHTSAELEAKYDAFMAKMLPLIPRFFRRVPSITYGYMPLDPALDNGTRGGGARPPTATDPVGRYVYPTFDLANKSLEVAAAHRIFHELAPGHVFQRELVREHARPSNLGRMQLRFPGYAEGWAEYAARLGIEMGAFPEPHDLYLQLLAEANNASRSVIDTGMNYLGMTLDDARAYLREHSPIMSDIAVKAETLRFGADTFGYCLSYRMGFTRITETRRRAEAALGDRFDLRDFHAVVLEDGSMPLDVLAAHVDNWVEERGAG